MPSQDITQLLTQWRAGDNNALAQLMPVVYDELHRIASAYLNRERANHTLQATALINEAYLQLVREQNAQWQNRKHFFRVAAQVMRHILVNHALALKTEKRGGGLTKFPLDELLCVPEARGWDLIALHDALTSLAKFDQRKSQLVELRFFAGLSMEEIAELMDLSIITIHREWRLTKAWLRAELQRSSQ